jgi:hypothetical protein
MSSSIYNSIRSTRVAPDIGEYAESFRTQGPDVICPALISLDMYGRPSNFNTINQRPHGVACQNQVAWIERENFATRPLFSEFLNDRQLQEGIECGGASNCKVVNPLPKLYSEPDKYSQAPYVYSEEYDTQKYFWSGFGGSHQ